MDANEQEGEFHETSNGAPKVEIKRVVKSKNDWKVILEYFVKDAIEFSKTIIFR